MESRVYWGKVIGTVAGLATMKPWFALLGLFIGHQFDRGFEARYQASDDQMAGAGRLPAGFLEILFETMGHLAKIDGRVTEDEIRAARRVMHRLGLKPAQVRNAINGFNDGKRADYPLTEKADELRSKHARRADIRLLFVRLLVEVSVSKGRVSAPERNALWALCRELEVGRVELAQIEAMIRAQRGFRQSKEGVADNDRVRSAYALLEVEPSADNAAVKKAYRRQMNRHHPDKLAGGDAAAVAAAEKKTRDIRAAYEMLKARRSIR